jgi:Virulence factor
MPELTVISWRDIPAQVTAGKGRGASRVQLSERFQEAIDAAAMRGGLIGTDAYLEEWRREARACGDDLDSEVAAVAAQLEADYTDERLERLARASGEEEQA